MKIEKNILVINSGSSSLKFQLLSMPKETVLIKGIIDDIGLSTCKLIINGATLKKEISTHRDAIKEVIILLEKYPVDAIGHRVVHGGEFFSKPTKITTAVVRKIDELKSLAPLHNPLNLAGILACQKFFKRVPQVAVFDTAFHQTIEAKDFLYGIPYKYYTKYGIRKYGFHGSSHEYIAKKSAFLLKKKKATLISCHLGNGSSITAIKNGCSIDTSMGFTPLQGLIMGSRCGDIDPGIISFLERHEHLSPDQMDVILNKKSGFFGVEGTSDMREVRKRMLKGDKDAKLVMEMLARDIARYIGAYYVLLGPLDAIVFTGGIGENAFYIRKMVMSYFKHFGIYIDAKKNHKNSLKIHAVSSKVPIFVIPTNEELLIAKKTFSLLGKKTKRKK